MENDSPDYSDPDFPYSGYLGDTQGLMFLARKDSDLSRQIGFVLRQMETAQDDKSELVPAAALALAVGHQIRTFIFALQLVALRDTIPSRGWGFCAVF